MQNQPLIYQALDSFGAMIEERASGIQIEKVVNPIRLVMSLNNPLLVPSKGLLPANQTPLLPQVSEENEDLGQPKQQQSWINKKNLTWCGIGGTALLLTTIGLTQLNKDSVNPNDPLAPIPEEVQGSGEILSDIRAKNYKSRASEINADREEFENTKDEILKLLGEVATSSNAPLSQVEINNLTTSRNLLGAQGADMLKAISPEKGNLLMIYIPDNLNGDHLYVINVNPADGKDFKQSESFTVNTNAATPISRISVSSGLSGQVTNVESLPFDNSINKLIK